MSDIKKAILDSIVIETSLCRNRDWVAKKVQEVTATLSNKYFLIDVLYKYGSFNDIICEVFDTIEGFNESKNMFDTDCSKWLITRYFSDGFIDKFNADL